MRVVYLVCYGSDHSFLAVFRTERRAARYIRQVTEQGSRVFSHLPNLHVCRQEVY